MGQITPYYAIQAQAVVTFSDANKYTALRTDMMFVKLLNVAKLCILNKKEVALEIGPRLFLSQ